MARDFDPYAYEASSPTFTNPDMILPFSAFSSSLSSSLPGKEPLNGFFVTNAQNDDYANYGGFGNASGKGMGSNGGRRNGSGLLAMKTPPPTNNRLSSALSDIQEVETTPRKLEPVPRISDTLPSSPTLTDSYGTSSRQPSLKGRGHDRRVSDSSSVHSDVLAELKWPGFNSSGGLDEDSVADDEEDEKFENFSKVIINGDDYEEEKTGLSDSQWLGSRPDGQDGEDDDPLSKRADMILANAKKRLNVLEGNLRGARHSLLTAPSASRPTPYLSQSVIGLRDRYTSGGSNYNHKLRQYAGSPLSSVPSLAHSRNQSEDMTFPLIPEPKSQSQPKRASSALGSFAGALNPWERSTSLRGVRSQEVMRESRLQSWMKESSPVGQPSDDPTRSVSAACAPIARSSSSATQSSARSSSSESVRPASALDLRTQMDELKGRISSLRERAQEDKKKRLSITSSTRTPSPFSTDEQWYTEGDAYMNHVISTDEGAGWSPNSSPLSVDSVSGGFPHRKVPRPDARPVYFSESPTIVESESEYQFQDAEETLDELEEESLQAGEIASQRVLSRQRSSSSESDSVDDEEDTESTGGDSEYFEAEPVLGERHEDRADAFDYENFFLHSAMGSFTRERSESFSSEDSIATTRPISPKRPATAVQIPQLQDERGPSLHNRSQSMESISTVATFQTANEGNSDSDSDDGELDDFTSTYFQAPHVAKAVDINHPPTARLDSDYELPPSNERTLANGNAFSSGIPPKLQRAPSNSRSSSKQQHMRHTPKSSLSLFPKTTTIRSPTSQRPISALVSSFLEIPLADESKPLSHVMQQDRELVKDAIKSLQNVCGNLSELGEDDYERRAWRRRIDAARRALDGEFEGLAR
ncbi:hypothetical protein EJ08DRAFT_666126 [Tothia fuscella]|uniref:Uncharacterized protein n=1 Tax=Tothia fuscella TaxID=1048955 RepID=A0A9P4TSY4_9PEZI|nr:hypothetical protein EJ08DRAFT_666126 [Tothia fuscella]